jgi:hypothetical protein
MEVPLTMTGLLITPEAAAALVGPEEMQAATLLVWAV